LRVVADLERGGGLMLRDISGAAQSFQPPIPSQSTFSCRAWDNTFQFDTRPHPSNPSTTFLSSAPRCAQVKCEDAIEMEGCSFRPKGMLQCGKFVGSGLWSANSTLRTKLRVCPPHLLRLARSAGLGDQSDWSSVHVNASLEPIQQPGCRMTAGTDASSGGTLHC